MSYTMIALLIAGFSAVVLKALAYMFFGTKKPNELLMYLEKHMPLLIMVILVCFLYKGLDYENPPYASDYIIAGLVALITHIIFKKGFVSIIAATGVFYILHEIIFKV
ncbi:branched-chain amino acid transport protein, AzlD family [Campylobacter sp. RM5004]|uniref:AzlD domain-containing protein n=1 Tax=Campylobacter sp. RM5004 TaxID=1660078 RepID=UPI001EFBD136|nr:AzlD domain-containing protein [Campylobacter sp. RM5004]ULO01752.1 branched-chain amino acid transport protein, AzlD family [Campylobacter sp. RM5004]